VDPALSSPRLSAALARLRERGERVTPARRAVLQVIDDADRTDEHLTAEQIGARVADLEPSIHRATLYRTLTALTETGVLSHVHLGGSATVYHLVPTEPEREAPPEAEAGTAAYGHGHATHAHVQCVECGRVLDVPPEALEGVAERLLDELGFTLDTSHAALLGRCADCS
jgi:Fur family ferric uptake transcriptional regulator